MEGLVLQLQQAAGKQRGNPGSRSLYWKMSLRPVCCCCAPERSCIRCTSQPKLSIKHPLAVAGESVFIWEMTANRYVVFRKEKGGDKEGKYEVSHSSPCPQTMKFLSISSSVFLPVLCISPSLLLQLSPSKTIFLPIPRFFPPPRPCACALHTFVHGLSRPVCSVLQ